MTHTIKVFDESAAMPVGVSVIPLGSGSGMLVSADAAHVPLDVLADVDLAGLLARAGHLVARGFDADPDAFNRLVARHSSRITLDPARMFHGSAAQKVDSGTAALGLHIENGTTPFAPDLLWFFCLKAAAHGSQTTVCDGYRVWDALHPTTRSLFSERPIRYSRIVPSQLWRRLAAHLVNDGRSPDQVAVADLWTLANPGTDPFFEERADGSLFYSCAMFAARPTQWSTQRAWANSLLGPSFNYEAPDMRFADGSPIPATIVREYTEVTAQLTEELTWVDRDVVLIDNTRVMHGRRAITDPDRSILNSQSYAREH